jgi:hypothetical protein
MKPESKGLTTPIPAPINKAVINRYSDEFVKTRRNVAIPIQAIKKVITFSD